jgi:hypothetical protein
LKTKHQILETRQDQTCPNTFKLAKDDEIQEIENRPFLEAKKNPFNLSKK